MTATIRTPTRIYRSCAQTVAPTVEPLDLPEVKRHLRVEHDRDNTDIWSLIADAREYAEDYTERQLCTATRAMKFDQFPSDQIEMPYPPLQSVTSVIYTNTSGVATTVSAATVYTVDSSVEPGRIYLRYGQSWPGDVRAIENAVVVTFIAGWANRDSIPARIKQAMKLIIHDSYYDRSGGSESRDPAHLIVPERANWLLDMCRAEPRSIH